MKNLPKLNWHYWLFKWKMSNNYSPVEKKSSLTICFWIKYVFKPSEMPEWQFMWYLRLYSSLLTREEFWKQSASGRDLRKTIVLCALETCALTTFPKFPSSNSLKQCSNSTSATPLTFLGALCLKALLVTMGPCNSVTASLISKELGWSFFLSTTTSVRESINWKTCP